MPKSIYLNINTMKRIAILITFLWAALASQTLRAVGSGWYLYVWDDQLQQGMDVAEFETTSDANVIVLQNFDACGHRLEVTRAGETEYKGLYFYIHNIYWAAQYGYLSTSSGDKAKVTDEELGTAVQLHSGADGPAWMCLYDGAYDLTLNLASEEITITTGSYDTGDADDGNGTSSGTSYTYTIDWTAPTTLDTSKEYILMNSTSPNYYLYDDGSGMLRNGTNAFSSSDYTANAGYFWTFSDASTGTLKSGKGNYIKINNGSVSMAASGVTFTYQFSSGTYDGSPWNYVAPYYTSTGGGPTRYYYINENTSTDGGDVSITQSNTSDYWRIYPVTKITSPGTYTNHGVVYMLDAAYSTAYVSGYTSDLEGDIVIPPSVTVSGTTYYVTYIADEAFKDATALNSIRIGANVTYIGKNAFEGCTGLTYVSTGAYLNYIDNYAFKNCSPWLFVLNAVQSVTMGTGVFSYSESYSGSKVSQIASLYVPALYYANSTYQTAFEAWGFKKVCPTTVVDGTIYGLWTGNSRASVVGYKALRNNVFIPSSLNTNIDYVPFGKCWMNNVERYAMAKAPMQYVTLANNTRVIYEGAFRNCTELTNFTMGEHVDSIECKVFDNDTKLTTINLYAKSIPVWGSIENGGEHNYDAPIGSTSGITLNYRSDATIREVSGNDYKMLDAFSTKSGFTPTLKTLNQTETSSLPLTQLNADGSTAYGVQHVKVNRSFAADRWYTLTLPFDIIDRDFETWPLTAYQMVSTWANEPEDTVHVWFSKMITMQGGVPLLVKCTDAMSETDLGIQFTRECRALITDKDRITHDNTSYYGGVQFIGNYLRQPIPAGAYFISNNKFYKATDSTTNPDMLSGYRAYMVLEGLGEGTAFAVKNLLYDVVDEDDVETGVVTLDAETLQSVNREGRGTEACYDLSGRRVTGIPTRRGIYIINGKKMVR